MKKVLIIVCLFSVLKVFAGKELFNLNDLEKEYPNNELVNLSHAIDMLAVSEVQSLINQMQISEIQKNILLNKINDKIKPIIKDCLIKLVCGAPLAYIGLHFFYKRFLKGGKPLVNIFRNGNYNFSIFGDGLVQMAKQLISGKWAIGDGNGIASRRAPVPFSASEAVMHSQFSFNIPVLIAAICCTSAGSALTIKALCEFFSGDLKKLKEIKSLIESVKVTA